MINTDQYESLKLDNQLCFPLYALSKEIIRLYKPLLDNLDLTYTQYITMMVLWEHKEINVKSLGEKLYLDSGTLTPLLKKLEKKGYIERNRSTDDERNLICKVTKSGMDLREKAIDVPKALGCYINMEQDDAITLYKLVNKLLENIK